MPSENLEIRCTCPLKPLLAIGGKDADGNGYVHIKTWKGQRLYAEVVVTSGTAHIHCRECLKWHTVRIRYEKVEVKQERLPRKVGL